MIAPFDKHKIVHIRGVDHPESIAIGPKGEAYTTGTGRQVYRIDLETNTAEQFAETPERCLGQAVDADGNLYAAHCGGDDVLKITPDGLVSVYSSASAGDEFMCPNYPAFDSDGNMYLSDSGDWSGELNGRIYRIAPGGDAELWYPEPVDTPNAIALDAEQKNLYFVETFGSAIARIAIVMRTPPEGVRRFQSGGRSAVYQPGATLRRVTAVSVARSRGSATAASIQDPAR